jgi:hypothetical protein
MSLSSHSNRQSILSDIWWDPRTVVTWHELTKSSVLSVMDSILISMLVVQCVLHLQVFFSYSSSFKLIWVWCSDILNILQPLQVRIKLSLAGKCQCAQKIVQPTNWNSLTLSYVYTIQSFGVNDTISRPIVPLITIMPPRVLVDDGVWSSEMSKITNYDWLCIAYLGSLARAVGCLMPNDGSGDLRRLFEASL